MFSEHAMSSKEANTSFIWFTKQQRHPIWR